MALANSTLINPPMNSGQRYQPAHADPLRYKPSPNKSSAVDDLEDSSAENLTPVSSLNREESSSSKLEDLEEALVSEGEKFAGRWVVRFLWYSLLEFIPGALYALPLLNLYIILGVFVKNPAMHQLKKWEMAVVLAMDALLLVVFIFTIAVIMAMVCGGTTGFFLKIAGFFSNSLNFCKI